jgi:hypothetical protein
MRLRAQAPSTRRLTSSVNAAWNGERTACGNSEAIARPTASRTPPPATLPAPATRPMATLVPITKPSGSTPITRLSTIAAMAAPPATGSSLMTDHQLRQRPRRPLTHLAQGAVTGSASQEASGGLPGPVRKGPSRNGPNRRDWNIAPLIRQDDPAARKAREWLPAGHRSGGTPGTDPSGAGNKAAATTAAVPPLSGGDKEATHAGTVAHSASAVTRPAAFVC